MTPFVAFVNKIYPIERMPRWIIDIYKKTNRFLSIFKKKSRYLRASIEAGKKKKGFLQYSVVTAVYNCEKYLDDYFTSLTRQSLDFTRNIQVILVDDGSTDNSARIIKKWQQKYPDNITYIYQMNQKQAIARNTGLPHVKNPWVTFIDADDFVHFRYFETVDNLLDEFKNEEIKLISCNVISYYEARREYKNDRPFRHFFKERVTQVPHDDLGKNIILSAASSFFSMDEIKKQNINFTTNSNIIFEDADFILRFLRQAENGNVLFTRDANYNYRKRANQSSTIDNAGRNGETYYDVVKNFYLPNLTWYTNQGLAIPYHVQNSVLYEMTWKLRRIFGNPKFLFSLGCKEEKILELYDELFKYIDTEVILDYLSSLSGFYYELKLGTLYCFKKGNRACDYAYMYEYDFKKNLICIRYFSHDPQCTKSELRVEDTIIPPMYSKVTARNFLSRVFYYEHREWYPLPDKETNITFYINDMPVKIDFAGKKYPQVSSTRIKEYFEKRRGNPLLVQNGPWLFFDRDEQADDNAEHLYRYVAQNYPEQKIYFALKKGTKDWNRLERDGFTLVDIDTEEFDTIFLQSAKIISSHFERCVRTYKKRPVKGDIIFLQHGVIKDDLSQWLNSRTFDIFLTSSPEEYNSIVCNGSPYFFGKKELRLTGLPRHDGLVKKNKECSNDEKVLLIMPTWRSYLQKKRLLISDIDSSTYAKAWLEVLHSKEFLALCKKYSFKVLFSPHFVMYKYFLRKNFPSIIEIVEPNSCSIQDLFAKATCMLTDYSSVAFEVAYLHKSVIYYQFDKEEFYKNHTYTQSYFDYTRDGFGPVSANFSELLSQLEKIMKQDGKPDPMYLERMQNTFAYHDQNNCKRVYDAIVSLDQSIKNSVEG